MFIDARTLPAGTVIDTEICIVGAGAAGIAVAREFIAAEFRVALIESGGMQFEAETQELYESHNVGQPFPNTTTSRLRFFGGTTNHWGGYCLPLDEIDFEARDDFPYHGWPFPKAHLDPWYVRAQEVCQLGIYDYNPARWDPTSTKVSPPFAGPIFERKILQENPLRFGPVYAAALRAAPRLMVYLYANAFHLDGGENDAEIRELSVKTLSGNDFGVRARFYVLATGGIENARLLLASGREAGGGLGNGQDLVGRFFMTHIVYSGGTIVPADPHMNLDFGANDTYVPGHYRVDRVFGLSAQAMRAQHLPNIWIEWTYQLSPVADALKALKRLTGGEGPGGSAYKDLSQVIGKLESLTEFAVRKVLFAEGVPVEALHLGCSSEQQPNRDSRVFLGSNRDRLGMLETIVDWRVSDEDRQKAAMIFRLLGAEIGRTGFGRLRSPFGEDDSWPAGFYGNEHHLGTTRMHADPTLGVVDANCRVHGVGNLYVAGSSVFPTGGANNPTLTIVALALQLADHLRSQLT